MKAIILTLPLLFAMPRAMAEEISVENDPMNHVRELSAASCGDGVQARLEPGAGGEMEEVLAVDFDNLVLDSSARLLSLTCTLKAKINVMAGSRFSIKAGAVHGYGDMRQRQGLASFRYSSRETRTEARAERALAPQQMTDLELIATVAQPMMTPCRNENTNVTLQGDVGLQLQAGPDDGSAIRITGNNQSYGTGWTWQWMDCFQGTFQSHYRAYNGQTYQAVIKLAGTTGTFHSSANFVGQLKNVTRDGRSVKGEWSGAGAHGWIRFDIQDFSTGRFVGTWGDERGTQGSWNGQW